MVSKGKINDKPSRAYSKKVMETCVESYGGLSGHSVGLMALDSNSMVDNNGESQKHFTPYRTPGSAGVNVFAQNLD